MPILPGWPGISGTDPSLVVAPGFIFLNANSISNNSFFGYNFTVPQYNILTVVAIAGGGGSGADAKPNTLYVQDAFPGTGVQVWFDTSNTQYIRAIGGNGGGTAQPSTSVGVGGTGSGGISTIGFGTFTAYTGTNGADGQAATTSSGAAGGHDTADRSTWQDTSQAIEVFGGAGPSWSSGGFTFGGGGGGGPGAVVATFFRGQLAIGNTITITSDDPSGTYYGPFGGAGGTVNGPTSHGNKGQDGYALIYWS